MATVAAFRRLSSSGSEKPQAWSKVDSTSQPRGKYMRTLCLLSVIAVASFSGEIRADSQNQLPPTVRVVTIPGKYVIAKPMAGGYELFVCIGGVGKFLTRTSPTTCPHPSSGAFLHLAPRHLQQNLRPITIDPQFSQTDSIVPDRVVFVCTYG